MEPEPLGLRERKNLRTQTAIERAALELALEQGYEHTSVDQIAQRADVSPRTVFTRYPTKESIYFSDKPERSDGFREVFQGDMRELVPRITAFLHEAIDAPAADSELERLRLRVNVTDPFLRDRFRGRLEQAETVIAQRLVEELGLASDDPAAHVIAASITGVFLAVIDGMVEHPDSFDPIEACGNALAFIQGGLDAIVQSRSPTGA
jgi:AcrR family transcriptional regulator